MRSARNRRDNPTSTPDLVDVICAAAEVDNIDDIPPLEEAEDLVLSNDELTKEIDLSSNIMCKYGYLMSIFMLYIIILKQY